MSLDIPAGVFVNMAGGALLVVLGIAVGLLRPRRSANVAFAVFAPSWGLGHILYNLATYAEGSATAMMYGSAAAWLAATGALVVLASKFPATMKGGDWPAIAAGAVAAAWSLMGSMFWAQTNLDAFLAGAGLVGAARTSGSVQLWSFFAFASASIGVLLMWAVRALPRHAARVRAQLILMSAALAAYWWFKGGQDLLYDPSSPQGPGALLGFAVILAPSVAWLVLWSWTSVRTRSPGATRLVLFALTAMLLGMLSVVWAGSWDAAGEQGGVGVSRIVAVLILAYAIVRHQLLDIDVRVKWTLKQSTVAAIFIAVFFIVSELAATAFSERLGTVAGIVAAGALVFAIVPLQHLGERLADKAMPGVKRVGEMDEDERLHAYTEAAEQAWADGAIDRSERQLLDRLASALGIPPEVAARIERESA